MTRAKGRPTKFTPDIRKALVDAITAGLTYTHACQIVGIDYTTFNLWRNKGQVLTKADAAGYFDFFNALTRAETNASLTMMATIRKVAQGYKKKSVFMGRDGPVTYDDEIPADWRAAAWWLERRYPDEYGRQRIEHTGKDGGPIEIVPVKAYKGISPDDWDEPPPPDNA